MRKNDDQLKQIYEDAKSGIEIGGYYAHYKHPGEKRYQVTEVGIMEGTWELLVVYKHVRTGVRTVRTKENFLETVEVDGKKVARFTQVQ